MLQVLPEVAKEEAFAMHGGTSINLFARNMPRLSVDIDLTYTRIEDRDTSLKNITNGLHTIANNILKVIPTASVEPISEFSGVKWKLLNLKKLKDSNPKKHAHVYDKLKEVLNLKIH